MMRCDVWLMQSYSNKPQHTDFYIKQRKVEGIQVEFSASVKYSDAKNVNKDEEARLLADLSRTFTHALKESNQREE